MTPKEELIMYMEKVGTFDKDSSQDGTTLNAYLIELTNIGARANLLMAEYKRINRIEKDAAYLKLANSRIADQKYYSVSLAKDYIDCLCAESAYMYDLAERCSRTVVHTMDSIRTVISSLKSERIFSQYQT